MRTPLLLLCVFGLAACSGEPPDAVPSAATPSAVVQERLRPVSGAQVCAALPPSLRKSLVTRDALHDDIVWRNNVATATDVWGECRWYEGASRSLSVFVRARGTAARSATDQAKLEFDQFKADAGKESLSWRYTSPVVARHGDAAYSVTGTRTGRRPSRLVHLVVRQGPWLMAIKYQGEDRDEAELREGAGRVADVFVAELAKESAAPVDEGPCGVVSAADVSAAFFPSVTEVGSSGDADDTTCTWTVREQAGQADGPCGRGVMRLPGQVAVRCGVLRLSIDDRDRSVSAFEAEARAYGEGARVERFADLGDRAFAVADRLHVLAGDRLLVFTYDGTNVDEAALRKSLVQVARKFVAGLATRE